MLVYFRTRHLLGICILLCIGAYTLGLFGGFLFDDFPNIVNNPGIRVTNGSVFQWLVAALSSNAGVLRRPISMLTFAADYYVWGLSPLAFKLTNLVIHLVNGLLFYSLASRLTPYLCTARRDGGTPSSDTLPNHLALFATAAWLLHPLNVSDVLYVVQRMNMLASLFILAGLICYTEGRIRTFRGESGLLTAFAGVIVFGLLATLSKENGALIVAYTFVIEAVCFRFAAKTTAQKRALQAFFILTLALPLVIVFGALLIHPSWLLGGYAGRDFTLPERLLTETRVLCSYLQWIAIPLPRWMGIYHDDITISQSVLHPITTLLAIGFLVAMIVTAWRCRKTHPGITFAIVWFLAGHSMESTILPLELVFDHRNYMPMTGLILGMTCAFGPAMAERFAPKTLALASGAVLLALAGTTAHWAYIWGNPLRLALNEVHNNPTSARAQYEAGRQIIFDGTANGHRDAAEQKAVPYFERGKALDPTDLYAASSLIVIHGKNGHKLDPVELTDLAHRVRMNKHAQINPFLVVMTAATSNAIDVNPEQMKMLVTAALENPQLLHTHRAMIMNDYGQYLFNSAHDAQGAVSMTLAATMEDPTNPLFQINTAKLALALDRPDIAAQHAATASKLDVTEHYKESIAGIEKQIDTDKNPEKQQ